MSKRFEHGPAVKITHPSQSEVYDSWWEDRQ